MELVTLTLSLAFAFAMLALSIALVGWSVRETLDIKRKPRTPRDTVRHTRTHAQRASLDAQNERTRDQRAMDIATQADADARTREHAQHIADAHARLLNEYA